MLPVLVGDADRTVDGMHILDAREAVECPESALALGIGVGGVDEIVRVLTQLGRQHAAALVVRAPLPDSSMIAAAVQQSGVALLGLSPVATWTQLATVLQTSLDRADPTDDQPQTLGGIPVGDLFALANAVSALIDAPITIEDRSSRVLAFSGRQDEADWARVATILGRQVPEANQREMEERGDFDRLFRESGPVYIEPLRTIPEAVTLPRVAVAVRAGDEILGSIWATVREPPPEPRLQGFAEAATVVALHLMQLRAGADVERRLRADLVSTALEGGVGSNDAVARLGLDGRTCVVLAMALLDGDADESSPNRHPGLTVEQQRRSDALAMHLCAVNPRATTALLDRVTYGILPVTGTGQEAAARAAGAARGFLERSNIGGVIGIGAATPARSLVGSRSGADRALEVLLARGTPGAVATIADVQVDALLLELDDLARVRGYADVSPIARLVEYDAKHHANLVETLSCWLDSFGDVPAAAERVFIHPNTFRYRLRRLATVGQIDLDDPDQRLAAMMWLRMLRLRG
jgi:hypothetical protein